MKRPNSMVQLLGYTLLIIGSIFTLAVCLNICSMFSTIQISKINPPNIFLILGSLISIIGLILIFIMEYKERAGKELKTSGMKLQGTVTQIRKLKYIRWGFKFPHVVHFYYERYGCRYLGKSYLIWEKSVLAKGDKINIYINDSKRHHFFADI